MLIENYSRNLVEVIMSFLLFRFDSIRVFCCCWFIVLLCFTTFLTVTARSYIEKLLTKPALDEYISF